MNFFPGTHNPKNGALNFFRFIGPGLLVTVGFIDPGNRTSNKILLWGIGLIVTALNVALLISYV